MLRRPEGAFLGPYGHIEKIFYISMFGYLSDPE